MRKNLKKLMAVSLAVTMTMASTIIASADLTGNGSFEGPEMENPIPKVKLPTTENINYIADPNDLITSTMSGDVALRTEYANMDFSGDTGIYFPNVVSGDTVLTYKNESQDLKAYNKSRQAVKITVKMEATSGDASLVYASGDVFNNSGDAARKVYFGVTDGASGDAAITGTGAAGAATFQTEVAGTESNFKAAYSGDIYQYVQTPAAIASGDAAWQSVTYKVKGAANKHGNWGKDKNLAFPQIKVTWTYADATAVPTVDANGSVSNGELWMSLDGSSGFSARPSSVTVNGTAVTNYTYQDDGWMHMPAPASGSTVLIVIGTTTYKITV